MEGKDGWYTTSGKFGLPPPPLAMLKGVGRQQCQLDIVFKIMFCCCCVIYTFKDNLIIFQEIVEALVYFMLLNSYGKVSNVSLSL